MEAAHGMTLPDSAAQDGPGDTRYRVSSSAEPADQEWDSFVAGSPGGNVVQLSLWAQVKSNLRWRADRIIVKSHGEIQAGVQILTHFFPVFGGIAYVTKGPLCDCAAPQVLDLIMSSLVDLCKSHRIRYLVVQPPNNGAALAALLPGYGLRPTSLHVAVSSTLVVNLDLDDKALLSQANESKRRKIRISQRAGISVREGSRADFPIFYELYVATSRRQGFVAYPREYLENMYLTLSPQGFLRLFIAEVESEAVSAAMVSALGDTVELRFLGWSGLHRESFPNDGLMWATFKWAKAQGYRSYDLGGIASGSAQSVLDKTNLPEEVLKSPAMFKIGFGGEVVSYPQAYAYAPHPMLHRAFQVFSENQLLSRAYKLLSRMGA